MNYEFLKTIEHRISQASIGYRLVNYATLFKKDYRKDISNEDFYMLAFYTLMFIDEESIKGNSCTSKSIEAFLKKCCSVKHINIDAAELTLDLLDNCFLFGGKADENFDSCLVDKKIAYNIISYEHTKGEINYYLSSNCRKWLYSSYEMETLGSISIEGLLARKEFLSGKFENAKKHINQSKILILDKIKDIGKIKNKIYSDLNNIDPLEFLKEIDKAKNLINEEKVNFERFREEVRKVSERKEVEGFNVSTEDVIKGYSDIQSILKLLGEVYNLQIELLSELQKIERIYQDELNNFSYLEENHGLNINKDILQKIKNNKNLEINLFDFFSPILGFKIPKFLSLNLLTNEQVLYSDNDEEAIEQDEIEKEELAVNEYVENTNETYRNLFRIIIENVLIKPCSLKTIYYKNKQVFEENIECLKTIISILLEKQKIDFMPLKFYSPINTQTYNFEPQAIHFYYTYLDKQLTSKRLVIEGLEDKFDIEGTQEDGMQLILRLNNVNFYLEEAI